MSKFKTLRYYGDSSNFLICEFYCNICEKMKPVLEADSSSREYTTVYICLECITPMFQAFNGDFNRDEESK